MSHWDRLPKEIQEYILKIRDEPTMEDKIRKKRLIQDLTSQINSANYCKNKYDYVLGPFIWHYSGLLKHVSTWEPTYDENTIHYAYDTAICIEPEHLQYYDSYFKYLEIKEHRNRKKQKCIIC